MYVTIARGVIAGLLVIGVSEISHRNPRIGAFLLTLPLVSVMAIFATWNKDQNLPSVSTLARETLILVPLGLPFFLPLAFAGRLNLGFWPAFLLGLGLASLTVGGWLIWGPQPENR
jgi:hypothetical protein